MWSGLVFLVWTMPKAIGYDSFRSVYIRWSVRKAMSTVTKESGPVETEMDLLRQILAATRNARYKESLQSGSPTIPCDVWPRHLIAIRNSIGAHVGFGFVIVHGGKNVLLSAAHVFRDVSTGGTLNANGTSLKIDTTWKLVVKTTMDFAGVQIPETFASQLGIVKMKLAKTAGIGSAVSTYGFINGNMVKTIGVISGVADRMKVKHTCSTLPGFCGSPLITGEKTVVGLHIESDGMGYNYAQSLDVMVVRKEGKAADDYSDDKNVFYMDDDLNAQEEQAEMISMYGLEEGMGVIGRRAKRAMRLLGDTTAYNFSTSAKDYVIGSSTFADTRKWSDSYDDDLPSLDDWKEQGDVKGKGKAKESGFQSGSEEALSPSDLGDISGKKKKKARKPKKKTSSTPSGTSGASGSQQEETSKDSKSQPAQSEESGKHSEIGDGPAETPKPPGSPSTSTPVGLKQASVSPPKPKKNKSLKRSAKAESIQELMSRIALLEASLATRELPSQKPISTPSE